MFVIVACIEDERGADSVIGVYYASDDEAETLEILAEMRDDNADNGRGYTYMKVV